MAWESSQTCRIYERSTVSMAVGPCRRSLLEFSDSSKGGKVTTLLPRSKLAYGRLAARRIHGHLSSLETGRSEVTKTGGHGACGDKDSSR